MTALSKEKMNSLRTVKRVMRPVSAGVKCLKGGIVACDAAGFYCPATGDATEVNVGARFRETVDNTAGLDGALEVEVEYFREKELVLQVNSTTAAVDVADRERPCFQEDDQTVTDDDTKSFSGVVFDVVTEGVWVDMSAGPRGQAGA